MATTSKRITNFDYARIDDDNINPADDSENYTMNSTLTSTVASSAKNPLLNCLVIKRVFHYSHLHDVKNFRLVCQEWNSIASPILRKDATVVFKRKEQGPLEFLKTFKRSNLNLPFTKFRFSEECIVEEAVYFMGKYWVFIKSLKFDCVQFHSPKSPNGNTKNITSKLWVKCINLSDLHINSANGTKMIIFIDHLKTVKDLRLGNCFLNLTNDTKISPSVISLTNVTFLLDLKPLPPQSFINEAFEFHKAKKIYIDQMDSNASILDVGNDVANIEQMTLNSTKVVNWETSQWSVNCLFLCKQRLKKKTTMVIKELNITDKCYHSHQKRQASGVKHVDLSILPFSLEKLSIRNEHKKVLINSGEVDLPNLKTLQIVNPESLTHFRNCPNIVSISLKGNFNYPNHPLILDLALLPQRLQKLEIEKYVKIIDTRPSSGEPFRINTLTLHATSFEKRAHILRHMQPDVFVLLLEGWEFRSVDILQFVHQNKQLKTVLLRSLSVKSSWALKSIGTIPVFYLFENQMCKKLTRLEFDSFLNVQGV